MSAVHKDPEDGKTGTINASEPECKNTAKRKKNMDKNIRLTEEKKPPVVSLKSDEKPDILMQKPSELQEVKKMNFKKLKILTVIILILIILILIINLSIHLSL